MQFMYKGEALNEPGNVDFGNADISGIGDGTVTGAIKVINSNISFKKDNSLISFSNKDSKLNNTSDSMLIKNNNQAVNICIAVQFNEAVTAGETDYILGKVSVSGKRPKIVQTTLSFTGTAIISLRVETNGDIIARVLYGSVPKDYAAWFAILYLYV